MKRCCMAEPWSAAESTSAEAGKDLPGQGFLDFVVPRNGFLHSGGWIDPDGMGSTLSFQKTASHANPPLQIRRFIRSAGADARHLEEVRD